MQQKTTTKQQEQIGAEYMDNEALILSNQPLPEDETTVTLDITSERDPVRGRLEGLETKIVEGKITFNPKSFRIFSIPARESTSSQPFITVDRTKWDLYLVWIPFTLHEISSSNAFYKKVTFLVTLANQETIAFDLFPRNVTTKIEETRTYTLSPQVKFQDAEFSLGQLQKEIRFDHLRPTIRAFGEGESTFYWIYTGFAEQREVTPETKHALIVLQVPHGTQYVDGEIQYEVVVAKRLMGVWRNNVCNVTPHTIRLDLKEVPPLYVDDHLQTRAIAASSITAIPAATPRVTVTPIAATKNQTFFDVCVVCALAEEAEAFIKECSTLCNVSFQQGFSPRSRSEYRHATISNKKGEDLSIHVSWLPGYGPLETGLHLKPVLEEFNPRFAAMTGICAGDRRKVYLGDLIVAERTFTYDTGKIVTDAYGAREILLDTDTQHPHSNVLQFVRMFDAWKPAIASLPRPASRRQQRDWLLNTLLDEKTLRVDAIPQRQLEQHVPDWREIVQALQNPQPYLTADLALVDKSSVARLRYGPQTFPFKDPAEATLHLAPMASGSTVRADNPFDQIRLPVRGTVAIDMEGAAFYRTIADFHGIRSLLVKSVSDYADKDKDDSYHHYASSASARYMLYFIREYVTLDLMPRLTNQV